MAKPTARRRPRREPMSRVDTAWLRMERATNPMMITGVLMCAELMTLQRLRRTIERRFLAYARFRMRPVGTATGPVWEEDEDLDLDWHVRSCTLPTRARARTAPPGAPPTASEKRSLERLVSRMASSPLDPGRPLWRFDLVERYGGGCALVARIHHCYADGMALVQVLLSLTDTEAEAGAHAALHRTWLKRDGAAVARRVGAMDRTMALGGRVVGAGLAVYRDPALAAVLAREGGDIGRELVHALSLPDDPPSVLRGRLGNSKRVAWAEPLDLEEVKAVGRACGCTVNDVLMATAAGALREHLRERGEAVDGLTLRATVPVNLRPLEHARKLGNHFGLVFLDLPVGEANPVARVLRVAQAMNDMKNSRQAIVAYGLLAALGLAPAGLQALALELFSRKASAVATNVPGPQQPLFLAGSAVRDMMFWVPQTGSIGVGLSILSYQGRVHFGLVADARLIPDPASVVRRFAREFDTLLYLALMGGWEHPLDAEAAEALVPRSNPTAG